jgi:DNA repair protein RecN (Recombination protein N)
LKGAKSLLGDDSEGQTSARDILYNALSSIEHLAQSDEELKGEVIRLREIIFTIEEMGSTFRRYAEKIVDDPERRAVIEERMGMLHRLKRKYKVDETGLIALRDNLSEEIRKANTATDRLKGLASTRDRLKSQFLDLAAELSKMRSKLGKKISREIKSHLADLDLPNATFAVEFETNIKDESFCRSDGIDRVELMIATNPAQKPAPMKKVASGGELSRLLIALKTVLANRDRVPVLVFDEAEAGIGGETAFKVAEKLVELSKSHQLILVSHLPQIASQADQQWVIEKSTGNDEASAAARNVTGKERVAEISRMLGARGDKKALDKLARSFLKGT